MRFQASLGDAMPCVRADPGLETPGYYQTVPPGPRPVAATLQSPVPEGPLKIARQFHWRGRTTQENKGAP